MSKKHNIESALSKPCTLTEVVQISQGVAADALADYHAKVSPVTAALSLQIELLMDLLMEKGMITPEEHQQRYMEKVEKFQAIQNRVKQEQQSKNDPKMDISANDIEVKIESRE